MGVLLICASAGAAEDASKMKPGDCASCHGGKEVLSGTHPDTKAMTFKQCLMCHGKDKVPLSEKFLSLHEGMLSGGSSGTKAPEAAGKDAEMKVPSPPPAPKAAGTKPPAAKPVSAKTSAPAPTCTACHAKPEYTKHFSGTKHGKLDCSACHKGISDISKHMQGSQSPQTASCLTCHKNTASRGLHATVKKFSCSQCHGSMHPTEASPQKIVKAKEAAPLSPPSPADCTACHLSPTYAQHFAQSSHGGLSCTTCHTGITDLALHMKKEHKPTLTSCGVCHQDVEKTYAQSAHALNAKLSCLQCHTDIHSDGASGVKKDKQDGIATCLKCHSDKDKYVNKGHSGKLLAGSRDAASCTSCHGAHDMKVFASTDTGKADKRKYYTDRCISCHKEGGVAGRVSPLAVKAYGETYHGKAGSLGYTDKVAGCADCHLAHNILPASDPRSALGTDTLVKTCGKCHTGFHKRFVSYVAHPDPDNPKGFVTLYLTKKFMIALLVGVFLFFWAHSLLWWRKAYAEKSCLIRGGGILKHDLPEDEGRQYVRRFTLRDRVMHVVLILSFFGVVISGFPIKYTGAGWAKPLITLMGGAEGAALIHRISAGAMCLLFLYTCWLSVKFLFPGFKVKGWVSRLFGPDSLFPRLKDLEDCFGMFKWFFNAGEKPKFDRWTYWEKFDFMAVFWGMFVIGLSGVIMWIPEVSSYVMPGWMINITHLAHSEEAFLAAVFIFTIHFFNNHLVPDKFPLERNVFTGSYTLEALKHERPVEYERIVKEGRLEEIKTQGPGTATQLFAGIFGIASVILGLTLTILIFSAVIAG